MASEPQLEEPVAIAEAGHLREVLAACARRTSPQRTHLVIGGHAIAVQSHCPELVSRVLRVFAHLSHASLEGSPHLTLHLLAPAQFPLLLPAFVPETNDAIAHRFRISGENFFALARTDTRSIAMVDRETGQAIYCAEASALPDYEQAAPLRDLLDVWFGWHDGHVLHGAAIGTNHGAVLLAGRGGSGKSTAALAGLMAGLDYLGDDYVLVTPGWPPHVHSLYASAKVAHNELPLYSPVAQRAESLQPTTSHKAMLALPAECHSQLRPASPIRAVLIPRVTGQMQSRLVPLAAPRALLALAPSSILQSAAANASALQFMKQLLASVPAFVLESGTDRAGIAGCIADWLEVST